MHIPLLHKSVWCIQTDNLEKNHLLINKLGLLFVPQTTNYWAHFVSNQFGLLYIYIYVHVQLVIACQWLFYTYNNLYYVDAFCAWVHCMFDTNFSMETNYMIV